MTLINQLESIIEVAAITGVAAGIDYIGGNGINHPMGDLAIGAGFAVGMNHMFYKKIKLSNFVVPFLAAGASIYPDIAKFLNSGESVELAKSMGTQFGVFGVGAFIGSLLGFHIKDNEEKENKYSRHEIYAEFKEKTPSIRGYEHLNRVMIQTPYILQKDSAIRWGEKPEDKIFYLNADIVGLEEKMNDDFIPKIEEYLSNTLNSLSTDISEGFRVNPSLEQREESA